MDFSRALKNLKLGKKLRRRGWNATNQYVFYMPSDSHPPTTPVTREQFGEEVPHGEYLAIKTVHGNVVPWLASQTDLLSSDWEVIE